MLTERYKLAMIRGKVSKIAKKVLKYFLDGPLVFYIGLHSK